MMIPTDYLAKERQAEYLREAARIHLLHLLKATVTEKLEKYGKVLATGEMKKVTVHHN